MKISGINQLTSWYSRVLDREGSGREEHRGSDKQQSNDPRSQKENLSSDFEVTDEQIQRAIDLFSKDSQAVQNGLSACTIGKGSGLRVVLKDADGHTLRSLRPSEFLAMQRDSQVSPKSVSKGVGKILDQKY
jgi:hypothetical protein